MKRRRTPLFRRAQGAYIDVTAAGCSVPMWKTTKTAYLALAALAAASGTAQAYGAMARHPSTGQRSVCVSRPSPRAAADCAASLCGDGCYVRSMPPGSCRYEGVTDEGESFWAVVPRAQLLTRNGTPRGRSGVTVVRWTCDGGRADPEDGY